MSGHDLAAAATVLNGLTPGSATVVVLMARERRTEIAQLLLACGWAAGTGAAVILAADALTDTTGGAGIFRGDDLPIGLQTDFDCECVVTGTGR